MLQLQHDHIVRIYDFYEDDPKYFYMVLELMKGGDLMHCIQRKVLAWSRLLPLVCRGPSVLWPTLK